MGWMRMMGANSVAYHEHTVARRGDDPVANALEYYASRGETPMAWGGEGCSELGLGGEVDLAHWRAMFGPGGACDPFRGDRLVACRRPGMELVISPHKSIAELGVIGRAEDMHRIADAERDATLAWLDSAVQEAGGRRGRANVRVPTAGLVWAVSRHATTRAGDPQVHDHVLVANVVSMKDAAGGWKGLDTAFLRDHLHAATAVGRMAAAAKAVQLGYGIEPDAGRSGRLGGWAIAGIPKAAWEIHATRRNQIDAAVGTDASYRSRSVAARATREYKRHEPVVDLVQRWRGELAVAGYPAPGLEDTVTQAGLDYRPPPVSILDTLPKMLLSAGGRLAEMKTFTRDQAIIAAAPLLHGLPVETLEVAVRQILEHPLTVALPAVAGAPEPVYAAACVLEDEKRIVELAERLAATSGPIVASDAANAAVALQADRGVVLTPTQVEVAQGILTSGSRLEVLIGVAGSGKTTTLAAVAARFEAAGYTVIGTATSGQAAKTLGTGAGVSSRTVASLTWRLEHERVRLTDRHVLILDEAGMTTDADVSKLLGAVDAAGAKVIVVGDYHQLDPVGPGGALEALTIRHPNLVWTLGENLRQADPAERAALEQLRSGNIRHAIAWYQTAGRVHAQPSKQRTITEMARAWAADVANGRDSLLIAYRRDNVAALNAAARVEWEHLGHLHGPALHTENGRVFQAGDRIITLTPGPDGAWVTSQAATITSVDIERRSVVAVTPDGARLHISGEHLGPDRVGYGYAITAHRSQGATVDTVHVLADGGGRELAYVAMSRARGDSHIYLTGLTPTGAADRLSWEWSNSRRQTWTHQPDRPTLAELHAQRNDLIRSIPPHVNGQSREAEQQHRRLGRELQLLHAGQGPWEHTHAGHAARQLHQARWEHQQAERRREDPDLGWWERRRADRDLQATQQRLDQAQRSWERHGAGIAYDLETRIARAAEQVHDLETARQARDSFVAEHPELVERIHELDQTIDEQRELERQQRLEQQHDLGLDSRHHEKGQEPDLGLGL